MNTFLKDVALQLIEKHPSDLDKVLVVFNNRRPSLFLHREFKKLSDRAIFLPEMIGMDDLIGRLGQLSITPNEYLLFELFNIHQELNVENPKYTTFESFISMADMMMADFSEIDLYMIDTQELFSNLHDLKAIGEWNIEEPTLTQSQRNYLSFYKSLYTYYSKLHKQLKDQGKAYSGMAYREVAENIDSMVDKLNYNKIYFVGFSVLSACEQTIIQTLVRMGKAEVITDGDAYYCKDKYQEAGTFFRKLNEWLPNPIEHPSLFDKEEKNITLVNCPEEILQAKYTGQLLDQWTKDKDHATSTIENTALVLADEGLLLPVLNALPEGVTSANVTMGFPYQLSGIHTFVLKLLSLYIKAKQDRFHHKDILNTLSDNYVGMLLGAKNLYPKLQEMFATEKVIYSNFSYIQKVLDSVGVDSAPIQFLFQNCITKPNDFIALSNRLIEQIDAKNILEHNLKERESVNCFAQIIKYFGELQGKYNFVQDLSTFEKIYTRLAQRHSVSFYGEPLAGLQILGMLETRNLNFDRIVIISTNEGTLPSGRGNNTLIPYSLKQHYRIPTHVEKDAVYAYHFYRLLQRAKDIHILYNTETTGAGKGEPSRFIFQIRSELASRFPNIHLEEKVLSVSNTSDTIEPVEEIAKNTEIIGRLQGMGAYGFSPSALNRYRNCPRQFYYQDVLRVKVPEEVNEQLDASEVGNCIHDILKEIHDIPASEELTAERLNGYLEKIEKVVEEKMKEEILKERSGEGRNRLLTSVAINQIAGFLRSEIEAIEKKHVIKIEALEKKFTIPLRIDLDKPMDVKIAGRIDRVDRMDEQLRVVDYKSGHTDAKELIVDRDAEICEVSDQWFQLMVYSWMYSVGKNINEKLIAGIIPLRNNKTKYLPAQWGMTREFGAEEMAKFQSLLKSLVTEILNPEVPFRGRKNKNCKYCAFQSICPNKE